MKGIIGGIMLGVALIVAAVVCLLAIAVPAWIAVNTVDLAPHDAGQAPAAETGNATGQPKVSLSSTTVETPIAQVSADNASVVNTSTVNASEPRVTAASLVDYGTDKDTYARGERANGFITVKNTGNTVIDDIVTSATASRSVPVMGKVSQSKDYSFTGQNLQPGEAKRLEFGIEIPPEYNGISTVGDYILDVKVKTGATEIGSFSKNVKVA